MRRLLPIVAAAVMAAATPAPAGERPSIHLPTEGDAVAVALGAESIFFGAKGVETILPGPVSDEERVVVGLGLDGAVRRVEVVQRLTISGLGDFQFKVAGPARDVEGLPESGVAPGLRRGSVLWQGFSEGEEVLAARMPLFPDQEADRLPVAFDLRMTVDGQAADPDAAMSGDLAIDLTIRNTTPIPIGVQRAPVDPERVAPVLDAVRNALRDGRRPVPGRGPVPERLPALREPETEVEEIEAPFRVEGILSFAPGTVRGLSARGGDADAERVTFGATLGGGRPLEHTVRISGEALGAGLPELAIAGEPALPAAGLVAPPGAGSWREAVRSGTAPDGGEMVQALLGALWRVARLRQFDAYLGNPDPGGPATTEYRFELLPPGTAAPPGASPSPSPPSPWTAAVSWTGLALLLAAAVVAWSRA